MNTPAPPSDPAAPLWPRWRMRCREAAAVLLRAQEMPLRWRDRVRLRLHLAACDACTQFQGQLTVMRSAMGPWRRYRDGDGPAD